MNTLTIGQDVWWSDPENKTSGSYLVLEIRKDPNDGLDDNTIILIGNGVSEAEVEACELQDLGIRRKRIKELVDKVTAIAENDNWSVYNHDDEYNTVDLYISKYSPMDQDFGFYIECKTVEADELIKAIEDYHDSYDPDEEAALWIGPDGHGCNGAPYNLSDLIEDMQECKSNVKKLVDLLNQEFNGIKITKPQRHSQFSERLYNIRTEVLEEINDTLHDICDKIGSTSVLWSSITNQLNTDICGYDQSVLPSTIGISDDNSSEFVIVFADYCNCSDSINGENIYTETLIDILQYLEEHLSKL